MQHTHWPRAKGKKQKKEVTVGMNIHPFWSQLAQMEASEAGTMLGSKTKRLKMKIVQGHEKRDLGRRKRWGETISMGKEETREALMSPTRR